MGTAGQEETFAYPCIGELCVMLICFS